MRANGSSIGELADADYRRRIRRESLKAKDRAEGWRLEELEAEVAKLKEARKAR